MISSIEVREARPSSSTAGGRAQPTGYWYERTFRGHTTLLPATVALNQKPFEQNLDWKTEDVISIPGSFTLFLGAHILKGFSRA